MKILVDADACPVKDEIIKTAKRYKLEVMMFIDTSHILSSDYAKIVTVEKGRDSVDIKLANHIEKGDIVVTQDYGVATMALAKSAYSLSQNGLIYDNDNIDRLLFERHLGQKIRRSGGKTSSVKKRTKEDNLKFEAALEILIQSHL